MARWGDCDFEQLKALQKRLEKMQRKDFDVFCQACAKELTARLLRLVIKRTPVGIYPAASGKKGGTLRRGWTAATESEAQSGGNPNVEGYLSSLSIMKVGNVYQIDVINPMTYASYVEFGHRTANHKGWVKGQFMLTISEMELEAKAPKLIEKKVLRYLEECFSG